MDTNYLKDIISRLRSEEKRWDAILELKIFDGTNHIFYLINLLNDKDWVVRWCVIEKLGEIGNPQAILPLLSVLTDKDPQIRKTAAYAIAKFGRIAVPSLVTQFKNLDIDTRKIVYKILINIKENIVSDLEAALKNQSWIVANRIIHLIWNIGGFEAEEALQRNLHVGVVQKNAILFLGQMKSKKSLPALFKLYKYPNLRAAIITSISTIGETAYHYVIHVLNSETLKLAKQAAKILVRIGPAVKPYLIEALKSDKGKKTRIAKVLKIILEKENKSLKEILQLDTRLRKILTEKGLVT